jgi:hypothetical protein
MRNDDVHFFELDPYEPEGSWVLGLPIGQHKDSLDYWPLRIGRLITSRRAEYV